MRELLRAESLKARTGSLLPLLLAGGLLLGTVSALGFARIGDQLVAAGQSSPATVTDDVVRAYMVTFLFAALAGAALVTRDTATGALARAVLEHDRRRVFRAKVLVAGTVGLGFGVVTAVVATIAPWALLAGTPVPVTWTPDTTAIVVGVLACNVAAALWGSALGWLIRNQIAAVGTVLTITLLIDPGLQRLLPTGSGYLFTIALSSIYRDTRPDLLAVPLALLVVLAWLGVLSWLSRRLFLKQDLG